MSRKYVMKSAEWVAQMEAQAARIAELDAFYADAAMQITAERKRVMALERQLADLGITPAMQLGPSTGKEEE